MFRTRENITVKLTFNISLPYGLIALICASQCLAEDVTFRKTRFSSVKQPIEAAVDLSITDSQILIKSNKVTKKMTPINIEIPYSSVDAMSYELATRHRVAEGAALMGLSLGAGAILMATKTKSHWLAIEYHDRGAKQSTMLRLDKSEYESVIAALQSKSGKHVAILDSKSSLFNPTAESKDVDEVVPFGSDRVTAALKPAMESNGCKVKRVTENHIGCKRSRGYSEQTGSGGESVTASLEAHGDQTRVRITTGKGVAGRLGKKNWSMPIYKEMIKTLQTPARAVAETQEYRRDQLARPY